MSATAHVLDGEVVESTAIDTYRPQSQTSLFRTDDPVEIITRATAAANALKAVVASRGLITIIQGREHPRVEAWQTLGAMLGVFPVKEWVREIPWPAVPPQALVEAQRRGLAFGFEASFRAQRADGAVLGGGEAACMRTETNWIASDDYAIRSMAQTRATSKALSAPLRFVMSLAGYETTPAEEMPADGGRSFSRPSGSRPESSGTRPASVKQRGLIRARAKDANISDGRLADCLLLATGNEPRFMDDDVAARWLKMGLERLPASAVDGVLGLIGGAA